MAKQPKRSPRRDQPPRKPGPPNVKPKRTTLTKASTGGPPMFLPGKAPPTRDSGVIPAPSAAELRRRRFSTDGVTTSKRSR